MDQRTEEWVPPGIDMTTPSSARTYDYLLGGAHNFEVDRLAAQHAMKIMPGIEKVARLNRAFLGRVVRFMAGQGVRQFLDLGSGIPTVGPVHQVADTANPGACRVVYVDRDPIAVAHSELMLGANDRAEIVQADVRRPDDIFGNGLVRRLLDFDEPIGLLMIALLHWIPDADDPLGLVAEYRRRLPAGSYLAIAHLTSDQHTEKIDSAVSSFNSARGIDQATPRPYSTIEAMFGEFDLVEPGLVGCAMWRPRGSGDITDDPDTNAQIYGGVAQKPQQTP